MLLVVDVGNTNIVLGIYNDKKLIINWRIRSSRNKTIDEYGIQLQEYLKHFNIKLEELNDVIISSVVPDITYALKGAIKRYLNLDSLIVGHNTKTGMNIKYDNPKEVGADRIVNAVGAYEKYGGPLIIIDVGTATTHDVISEDGIYLGGTISPGINISAQALYEKTAKLPNIELLKPRNVIGKNTVESMQSGIVNGFIGLIDYLTSEIIKEKRWDKNKVKVVTTGGYADMLSKNSNYSSIVDNKITLYGLRIIYERTKNSGN